jgi:hypothetical protein
MSRKLKTKWQKMSLEKLEQEESEENFKGEIHVSS